MTSATKTLLLHIKAERLPEPEFELRLPGPRKWKFDLAFPEQKILVEIHGAVFRKGRHVTGTGFTNDREKMNYAQESGWRVFEYTTGQMVTGEAIRQLKRMLL